MSTSPTPNQTTSKTAPQEYYEAVFGLEGKPVPPDMAEAVAQWCVFVGDRLNGSQWLIIAAQVIREQAKELRARDVA